MAPDPSLTVLQGTLDVLVLKALALGPQHGYGICAWLSARTDGELDVERQCAQAPGEAVSGTDEAADLSHVVFPFCGC